MGVISSIISGVIGSDAAGNAAYAQETAAKQGLANSQQNQQQAIGAQQGATQFQQNAQTPYTQAGSGAVTQLSNLLGSPGGGWNQSFQAPTASASCGHSRIPVSIAARTASTPELSGSKGWPAIRWDSEGTGSIFSRFGIDGLPADLQ